MHQRYRSSDSAMLLLLLLLLLLLSLTFLLIKPKSKPKSKPVAMCHRDQEEKVIDIIPFLLINVFGYISQM